MQPQLPAANAAQRCAPLVQDGKPVYLVACLPPRCGGAYAYTLEQGGANHAAHPCTGFTPQRAARALAGRDNVTSLPSRAHNRGTLLSNPPCYVL